MDKEPRTAHRKTVIPNEGVSWNRLNLPVKSIKISYGRWRRSVTAHGVDIFSAFSDDSDVTAPLGEKKKTTSASLKEKKQWKPVPSEQGRWWRTVTVHHVDTFFFRDHHRGQRRRCGTTRRADSVFFVVAAAAVAVVKFLKSNGHRFVRPPENPFTVDFRLMWSGADNRRCRRDDSSALPKKKRKKKKRENRTKPPLR